MGHRYGILSTAQYKSYTLNNQTIDKFQGVIILNLKIIFTKMTDLTQASLGHAKYRVEAPWSTFASNNVILF